MAVTRAQLERQLEIARRALATARRNRNTDRIHRLSAQAESLEKQLRETKEEK